MALIRPILGTLLFYHFHNHEARCIERAWDNKAEPRFNGLSLREGRHLILTAEARAQYQPEKLRLWFTYSRFYLYLAWYKANKLANKK
jgi:hypothetical protein